MGAGLGLSYARSGEKWLFFRKHAGRFVLLFALGFLLDFVLMLGWKPHWMTILGIIGTVGIETLFFLWLPKRLRLPVLVLLPFVFFPLQSAGFTSAFDSMVSFGGGAYGVFTLLISSGWGAWAGMGLAEKNGRELSFGLMAVLVLLGLVSFFFWPVDFSRVGAGPAYALVISALGILLLIFLERTGFKNRPLQTMGFHALLIFVLEYFFIHYPWRVLTNGEPLVFDPVLVFGLVLLVNLSYFGIASFLSARAIRLSL
ncbi:MAG: hypothetical protein HY917_04070 [Candidatus Diapherotrites archaeon]|nr:hypothetical protein [Candidatus Diapherotrites archaeon]